MTQTSPPQGTDQVRRLGRVAHAQGMSFAEIEQSRDEGGEPQLVASGIVDHPFGPVQHSGQQWVLGGKDGQARLVAPVLPSKVIGIGKNYAAHVEEMREQTGPPTENPTMFLKPATTVIGPGLPIKLPPSSERVDFEGEVAVVIGAPCRNVPAADAARVILGYTLANDVTARDLQHADGQWTRAKGFDTFCPIGPWITTGIDAADLEIMTEVDGQIRQRGRTSQLIHTIPELVAYVSGVMTLLPGDMILTGTPAGVGPLTAGQHVTVSADGLGLLNNPVAAGDGSTPDGDQDAGAQEAER